MKKTSIRWSIVGAFVCGCWLLGMLPAGCEPTTPTEKTSEETSPTESKPQESSPEPTSEPTQETAQEPAPEPAPDGAAEPTPEPAPDQATDGSGPEPSPEPTPEPQPEGTPEPSSEGSPEAVPDGPVTAGACQSMAPKCPTGYLCRDDVPPPTCHRRCDPSQRGGCPTGHLCQVLSSGEGICVQGTAVQKGAKCDPTKICDFGLVCVLSAAGSTEGTCYQRCTLDALQSCPSSEYCFLVHSRNGVCLPGPAGSKDEGASCQRSNECKPGQVCFTPTNQSPRCAKLCDTNHPCTSPLRCVALKDAPKDAGACIQ